MKKGIKVQTAGKNQSSMTSVKYDHQFQAIITITGQSHRNPLKTEEDLLLIVTLLLHCSYSHYSLDYRKSFTCLCFLQSD